MEDGTFERLTTNWKVAFPLFFSNKDLLEIVIAGKVEVAVGTGVCVGVKVGVSVNAGVGVDVFVGDRAIVGV